MNVDWAKPYIFQPFPPQPDGRFYGVAGGRFDSLKGLTKVDAQQVVYDCESDPKNMVQIIENVRALMEDDWRPDCGCRFESLFSNSVLLCAKCSKDPAHNL